MPLTRTQGEAALKHVVVTVLDEPEDGELMKALKSEGYLKVSALTSLRETTIENLTYPEDDGTLSKVKQNQKGLLVAFCAFIKHRNDLSLPIGDDWTNITQEEYDDFRVSRSFDGTIHGLTPASRPGIPPAPSARAPAARDPIADFQRGIKRDASLFPALKDEKEFDNWQRITTAQCKAQDISEVLDPNYRPNTTEDRELFKKKQEYMYAVLVNTLKTDQGQSCVRKFATTSDAQSIYRDVVEHNLKSTKASISAGKSLAYVTCTTIGEGSDWRGTTEAFIHHWQDQVRLYETLVNPDECFSSAHKKNMLQNAVRNVSELAIVKAPPNSSRPMMAENRPMTATPASFFLLLPRTIATLLQRLSLDPTLLVALCTLTITQSQTVITMILSTISTVHSMPFRPIPIRVVVISLMPTRALLVVHLVPAWHFPSGTSYPRMLKISGMTYQMRPRPSSSTMHALLDEVLHDPLFATLIFMMLAHTTTSWRTLMIFALEAKEMSTNLRKRCL
jgi:hypothetical protein